MYVDKTTLERVLSVQTGLHLVGNALEQLSENFYFVFVTQVHPKKYITNVYKSQLTIFFSVRYDSDFRKASDLFRQVQNVGDMLYNKFAKF